MQHARHNVKFMWNFFESGHGKGDHDGARACVKCALHQHELAGTINFVFNLFISISQYNFI